MNIKLQDIPALLNSGGIIAYPTETLWGLGANALDNKAVDLICEIKGRDLKSPISVLVYEPKDVFKFVEQNLELEKFLYRVWPGALTLILPVKKLNSLAPQISSTGFVGFRVSPHPLVSEVLERLEYPLTTTSANKSGSAPAQSENELGWLKDYEKVKILSGETLAKDSKGSTVVKLDFDARKAIVIREGDFSIQRLNRIIDEEIPELILKVVKA